MNRDDIIRMAQEAGFCHDINNGIYLCAPMHIERFAALVAAAERAECAKVCEIMTPTDADGVCPVAAAIRARGQE